jgi:hypothetical protein
MVIKYTKQNIKKDENIILKTINKVIQFYKQSYKYDNLTNKSILNYVKLKTNIVHIINTNQIGYKLNIYI